MTGKATQQKYPLLSRVSIGFSRFGITPSAFHTATRQRAERWPHNMLASKRSEDVRARINVLSEIPDAWEKSLRRWSRINRSKRILCDGDMAPAQR